MTMTTKPVYRHRGNPIQRLPGYGGCYGVQQRNDQRDSLLPQRLLDP
jgi:hypothetical protein